MEHSKVFVTRLRGSLLLLVLFFFLPMVSAQRPAGSVGIGAQFGQPTGLTLKVYQPRGVSWDFLAAWDLDDFYFLNVHGLVERHVGGSDVVHFFIGPGLFLGISDSGRGVDGLNNNEVTAGLSGSIGLNFVFDRVELFGQLTPRLQLTNRTDGALGGGGGIRFYF